MLPMPIVSLLAEGRKLAASGKRVSVLWQHDDTLAFIARGREYRSEFHINPSDETMYMIKGEMRLHYRTPEEKEDIAVIAEGAMIYTPAGIPHSPRFPSDAIALISERKRRDGEIDRFHWYCPRCDTLLHEEQFIVNDYAEDPVSKAYQRFFESLRVWSSGPASSAAKLCRRRRRFDYASREGQELDAVANWSAVKIPVMRNA